MNRSTQVSEDGYDLGITDLLHHTQFNLLLPVDYLILPRFLELQGQLHQITLLLKSH